MLETILQMSFVRTPARYNGALSLAEFSLARDTFRTIAWNLFR